MKITTNFLQRTVLSLAITLPFGGFPLAYADHIDLDKVEITAVKPGVPDNVPNTVEAVTKKQIEESANTVTTAGALQYLPSVHVRERYIGDRNGILVMRLNSSIASAQTTIYADGLLLSNFLNNSFSTPPRWGMVSPDQIERIDVMYGPFSALYPGNSAGGVLNITTSMPTKFEAHAATDVFTQNFKLYGTDESFSGHHESASIGDKWNDLSLLISLDHLDSHGQPQTFGNATRSTSAGGTTAVTGEIRDLDPQGKARIITATTGIDHTVQNNATIKVAYDFTPTLKGTYTLGFWQNDSDGSVKSYLKDKATGRTFFNTSAAGATRFVTFDGDPNKYTLTGTGPSHAESEHWMHGISLKTNTDERWDWEAIATIYNQSKDFTRTTPQSANPVSTTNAFDSGDGAVRPSGTFTDNKGTGWQTLDLRGDYRPDGDLKSEHQWSFGYHFDRYELETKTLNVTDWLNSQTGALSTNSFGKTQTQALYLQDSWKFAPDWILTPGGRFEHWKAYDGSNFDGATTTPAAFKQLNYADRQHNDFSPKLSLSWQARPDWLLRASYGKAYRYPTVAELFQRIVLPDTSRANDPNLKPESVNSVEFTGEKLLDNGLWRTSLFVEDKSDALISQTDTTTVPGKTISSIQNVDKIRSTGVETSVQFEDLFIHGFDFQGSMTYVDSEINKNAKNPFTVGKPQPRIPDWRATFVGVYHFNHQLSLSLAGRYSGNQEVNLLYNTVEPQTYGTTVSRYAVFDTKLVYRPTDRWTASFGINNIGNYKYYVNPNPYPQRQFFAGLKFDY
ncbi:MAG: TonB-dependent receptor [Methylophilaceae bacterium]